MLDCCFNPACKRELLYLRDGRVVRLVKAQREQATVEHFWLCGECYQLYDFQFSSRGDVRLSARGHRLDDTDVRNRQVLVSAEICEEETAAA